MTPLGLGPLTTQANAEIEKLARQIEDEQSEIKARADLTGVTASAELELKSGWRIVAWAKVGWDKTVSAAVEARKRWRSR